MAVEKLEVGKTYKWDDETIDNDYFVVTNVGEDSFNYSYPTWNNGEGYSSEAYYNNDSLEDFVSFEPYEIEPVADAISPSVYQFPNGVEVRDISAHLTSFGGQAVQYIARATRLDGVVKGLPVQDLKKAIQLLEWEVERLES